MCKCNVEKVLISTIDNFGMLADFGVQQSYIDSLIKKGAWDEGYLYKCPVCGEFNYVDEMTQDIASEYTEDMDDLKKCTDILFKSFIADIQNGKYVNTVDKILRSLQDDLGRKLGDFLKDNGKLMGSYGVNTIKTYYKLKDSTTGSYIIFVDEKDTSFNRHNYYRIMEA